MENRKEANRAGAEGAKGTSTGELHIHLGGLCRTGGQSVEDLEGHFMGHDCTWNEMESNCSFLSMEVTKYDFYFQSIVLAAPRNEV